jgi:hypothetical protein
MLQAPRTRGKRQFILQVTLVSESQVTSNFPIKQATPIHFQGCCVKARQPESQNDPAFHRRPKRLVIDVLCEGHCRVVALFDTDRKK